MDDEPDILLRMTDAERHEAMRDMVFGLFGPKNGARMWREMEPAMTCTFRQLGDADDPEKNHWKGVWRIHELA